MSEWLVMKDTVFIVIIVWDIICFFFYTTWSHCLKCIKYHNHSHDFNSSKKTLAVSIHSDDKLFLCCVDQISQPSSPITDSIACVCECVSWKKDHIYLLEVSTHTQVCTSENSHPDSPYICGNWKLCDFSYTRFWGLSIITCCQMNQSSKWQGCMFSSLQHNFIPSFFIKMFIHLSMVIVRYPFCYQSNHVNLELSYITTQLCALKIYADKTWTLLMHNHSCITCSSHTWISSPTNCCYQQVPSMLIYTLTNSLFQHLLKLGLV